MFVIHGKIPNDLRGTYIKNGPVRYTLDAPGFIQKIHFDGGVATYTSRVVDVVPRPFKAFEGPWIPLAPCLLENAANTNIVRKGPDSYWALYDGGSPTVIDAQTLGTKGTVNTRSPFVNSHPKGDGNVLLELDYVLGGVATSMRFGNDVDIIYPKFIYIHDFFMTPSYFGFIDHKMTVDLSPFACGGIAQRLRHQKNKFQELVLVSRTTKEVKKIPVHERGFISHYIHTKDNCEEGTLDIVATYYPEYMRGPAVIRELTVCLSRYTVIKTRDICEWGEFPTAIGDKVYLSRVPHGGIIEYDTVTKCVRNVVKDNVRRFYAEVAHDPMSGYRLCYVYDFASGGTTLAIFNQSWSYECELGFRSFVCPGLHGNFYN